MKKRIAAFAAILMAFVFVFPAVSIGFAEDDVIVPEGYNEHDYLLVLSFLETCDEEGVKNGEKLNPDYDPNDMSTWGYHPWPGSYFHSFAAWTDDEPKRLYYIGCESFPCVGDLIISDCTGLVTVEFDNTEITSLVLENCLPLTNVYCSGSRIENISISGCPNIKRLYLDDNRIQSLELLEYPSLAYVRLDNNRISELTLGNLPALRDLRLGGNLLSELDVSSYDRLIKLNVNDNLLTELDVSSLPRLDELAARGNFFTELDFNSNHVAMRGVRSIGTGNISYECYFYEDISETPCTHYVHAEPGEGFRFVGWYNEQGELVSEEADFGGTGTVTWEPDKDFGYIPDPLTASGEDFLAARFVPVGEPFLLGDCNGNGVVESTDALLTMRCALRLIEETESMLVSCDMNASGAVDSSDALMIMRLALGI